MMKKRVRKRRKLVLVNLVSGIRFKKNNYQKKFYISMLQKFQRNAKKKSNIRCLKEY